MCLQAITWMSPSSRAGLRIWNWHCNLHAQRDRCVERSLAFWAWLIVIRAAIRAVSCEFELKLLLILFSEFTFTKDSMLLFTWFCISFLSPIFYQLVFIDFEIFVIFSAVIVGNSRNTPHVIALHHIAYILSTRRTLCFLWLLRAIHWLVISRVKSLKVHHSNHSN